MSHLQIYVRTESTGCIQNVWIEVDFLPGFSSIADDPTALKALEEVGGQGIRLILGQQRNDRDELSSGCRVSDQQTTYRRV